MANSKHLLIVLLFAAVSFSCKKEVNTSLQKNMKTSPFIPISGGNYWERLAIPNIRVANPFRISNFTFQSNGKVYVVILDNNQLWEYDPASSFWIYVSSNFFDLFVYRHFYLLFKICLLIYIFLFFLVTSFLFLAPRSINSK